MICQVIGTVFTIAITIFSELDAFAKIMTSLSNFFVEHTFLSFHLIFISSLIFEAVMGLIYFLVSKYVMKNKLNLE